MKLYEGLAWEVIFTDWCQDFPGNCIISNNKQCLSELTYEEWLELGLIEKELERITKKLFNATMFNFACLMNDAYKNSEKPHVHFHFIPRYQNPISLFKKKYKDKHFGYNMWKWSLNKIRRQKDIFTKEEKEKMFEMMKDEFSL